MNRIAKRAPTPCSNPARAGGGAPTRALLSLGLLALGACSCAKISTTKSTNTRILEQRPTPTRSDWEYSTSATARGDSVVLTVQKTRYCEAVVHRTGERTTTFRRENDSVGLTWLATVVGVAGASAVTWAMLEHADGEVYWVERPDGSREYTSAGAALYLGLVGSLGLITAAQGTLGAIDTESTEPWQDEHPERKPCGQQRAAGVTVQVRSGELLVAEAQTSASGEAELRCLLGRLATLPESRLVVDGAPAQAPAAWFDSALAQGSGEASTQELTLLGERFARATRSPLEAAIERRGGVATAKSDHVSEFDVRSIGWNHAEKLKLLFDGEQRLVKAKWTGDLVGQHRARVLKSLQAAYGPPQRVGTAEQGWALLWRFADGMELRHEFEPMGDGQSCPQSVFTYVDVDGYARFEAAVRETASHPRTSDE